MNFDLIKNKSIALLIWDTEKENSANVYLGNIIKEHDRYCFVNEEKGWKFHLNEEQLSRLREVTEDLKEVFFNADFGLPLSIGNLPANADDFVATGMKYEE